MFVYAFMKILVKGFYYKTNSVFGTKWTYRLGVALMLPAILFVPFRFGLDWTKYQASLVELGKSAGEAVASRDTSELQSLVVRSFSSLGNKIHDGGYEVPVYGLVLLMCFMGTGDGLTYLSVVMLITDSVPETQYGLIHGLGGCLASIVRTIGPTLGGVLWEAGGANWVVFVVTGLIVVGNMA
ncbi:hypothetical protein HDU79_001912, partial [Rhizoclosmatium sp. JEL0117]